MADDRLSSEKGGGGEIPPTVVSFGRPRSPLQTPIADKPAAEAASALDNWPIADPTPAGRGPSGLVLLGSALSLIWVVTLVAWFIVAGETSHEALLATSSPLSLAGVVAIVVTPLILLWLVIAVFDRNASIHREAAALRQQLALLTYPAAAAESRIATIADSLRTQTASLTSATREAAAQAQDLRQVLARETEDLGRLTEHSRSGLAETLAQIAARTDTMHGLMRDVGRLATTADETLAQRSDTLTTAARRAAESADSLDSVLTQKVDSLTALSDGMGERTKAIESMATRQETAAETMRVAALALGEATDALSVRAEATSDNLAGRAAFLVEADHRLSESASHLASQLRTILDLMGENGREADRRTTALEDRTRQLSELARSTSRDIAAAAVAASGDFTTFREGAREALEGAKAVITALRDGQQHAESLSRSMTTGIASLREAGEALQHQRDTTGTALSEIQTTLAHTIERAAERLRHMQDLLGRNAVEVTRASARATVEIETVADSLKSGLGRIDAITTEAREATLAASNNSDKVVSRLQNSALALLSSVEQLHKMGSALGGQSEKVVASANAAIANVKALTDQLREEGDIFATLTATATGNAETMRSVFTSVVRELEDNSSQAAHRLQVAAEVFEHTSDHAAALFSDTSEAFEAKIKSLRQTAEQASLVLTALNSDFDQRQGGGLVPGGGGLSHETNETLQSLVSTLERQLESLASLPSRGGDQGDYERSGEILPPHDTADIQRFLTQISYIFEKLQAAAVDLSRLFTPAVEEELWKRFYKGEQNVFLRHAAKTITRAQSDAVRSMYQGNPEFREYVTRYMGEFDSLMKITRQNERAEVLTAIFTSSDMGRLYVVIARALNREITEPTAG